MTLARAVLLAAVFLALAGCGRPALDRLSPGGKGVVAEVRSGDTLVLRSGETVRLVGIDAPNRRQSYAAEAKAVLERLALGKPVQLLYGGVRKDGYGRTLAHVRLEADDAWLQQALLEEGIAWVRTYPDNRALAAEMLKAEEKGRRARKGVWALEPPLVRLPIEAVGRRGFHIVEGRVTLAGPDALVLDDVVRAEVVANRRADFAALDLAKMKGRLVRVRGRVGADGVLRLDHPEQVEALQAPPG